MKVKSLSALLLCISPGLCFAHSISIDKNLPDAGVSSHGEIFLEEKKVVYKEWNTAQLPGKVRVIQAIAGRKSAKKMNADLMQAITASEFPADSYQTTTIINQDDSIWGTGSFVKSSAEESKEDFPWSSIILDKKGSVASTWQLKEESSAIVVLDKTGKVLFVHEGALEESQINQVLKLVSSNL